MLLLGVIFLAWLLASLPPPITKEEMAAAKKALEEMGTSAAASTTRARGMRTKRAGMSEPRGQLPIVVGIDGQRTARTRCAGRLGRPSSRTPRCRPSRRGSYRSTSARRGRYPSPTAGPTILARGLLRRREEDPRRGDRGGAGQEPPRVGDAPAGQRASGAGAHRGLAARRPPRGGRQRARRLRRARCSARSPSTASRIRLARWSWSAPRREVSDRTAPARATMPGLACGIRHRIRPVAVNAPDAGGSRA